MSKVPTSTGDTENQNYFYIFENSDIYPTIVALEADYNANGLDNGDNQTKYYPVIINKESTGGQNGTKTISRNNQYKVNITIKGMGVNNPYEPIDPASLNVE